MFPRSLPAPTHDSGHQNLAGLVVLVAISWALPVVLVAEPPASNPAPTLDGLAFMVGSWRGGSDTVSLEEVWTAPRGGVMLGLNRTVTAGGTQWEFLRIEPGTGVAENAEPGLIYWASPGGVAPTPFELVELGEGRAVFANPQHDFPQRLIYTRHGDHLHARVEAGEGDAVRGFDLEWQLVAALD